ncbi:class I SAM-dependent RNA methyltransferase [Jiella endophytica]|uniref:class I SAM-dependent RNA methyltransferase n=1 Tax=Jiella endophytica TaxID=2558362 RepID=UPI001FE0AB14|nr:class I SAM-dependent RNA methyltransferase [Jiella endophytica]
MRVTIESLGAKGDGTARTPAGPVFLPFTLPGEVAEIDAAAEGGAHPAYALVEEAPDRRAPACPHFGQCGGCDLQHANEELYRAFKRELVVSALERAGVGAEVAPLVACPPRSRRRVTLTAVRAGNRVLLGYNAARSNRVVAIETCPIALPAIEAALPFLQKLAGILIDRKRPLKLLVTATTAGLDVSATDASRLSDKARQQAIGLTLEAGIARLAVDGEILVKARPPLVDFAGVAVEPPPGAFLQAVESAETAMAELVLSHLSGAKRVVDYFSGCGTFSLRLARHAAVHAVESEAAALEAQDAAHRRSTGLKPLSSERRDLARRPVPAKEMKRFDGIVFDPPRAGAEGLSREIAGSGVPRVAAVSCNPVTLARDIRILVDGGYRLLGVTPIDQFLWSHHVEAVALLTRDR